MSLWINFFCNIFLVKVVSALDRRNLKLNPNERKIETLVKQRSFPLNCFVIMLLKVDLSFVFVCELTECDPPENCLIIGLYLWFYSPCGTRPFLWLLNRLKSANWGF